MAGNREKDRRLAAVAIVLVIGLTIVTGKLVLLQGIQAERYRELASEQRDTALEVTPRRGTVFDREGEILAISEDVISVYATPYQVENVRSTAQKIAEVLGEDPDDIAEKLGSSSGFVYIARKLDKELGERLKGMKLDGIGFIEESRRFYPLGEVSSQVLGIVDVDNNGQAGLELYYDDVLGGKPGKILLERDAAGDPIPGSEEIREHAEDGVDIQLTLDKDVQTSLEESLESAIVGYGARAATGVVMDCNNGDILAMATRPTFDPNDREDVTADEMRNRAVTDVYEPGSVLKVVTAVAALQEGVVTTDSRIQVPSRLQVADEEFTDSEPTPAREMDFNQVISQSSNVGTILVAQQLGRERLFRYLDLFGIGHGTGVDYPGEVGGLLPSIDSWSGTSVATMSIGQGVSVTTIQLACIVGAVANGGRRVCPHFLKAKITGEGMQDMGLGGLGERIIDEETCRTMSQIMEQVVAPGGTGARAQINYYRVAGKTGTAAKPRENAAGYSGNYMATFVGFAPAEKPRLVTVITLDEPVPIWGGHTSAPVFKDVMGFALQHLKIPPSWETQSQ